MSDDKIADLSKRRWDEESSPAEHKPIDALKAAIREIESDVQIDHVIILIGQRKERGAINDGFKQAGDFNGFEQVGLIHHGMHRMLSDTE